MPSKFNFSKAFTELEKIVGEFEQGDVDLDVGLVKFERGLALARELKKYLTGVENKVEILKTKFQTEAQEMPE